MKFSFQRKVRKTPTVLQMEMTECGAASLAMILEYHGRYVPLEELRLACGVSRDGAKASNVLKAAQKYGLKAKGFKKSLKKAQELIPPYIVFWNFNHFLVVEGFSKGQVYLNDPAKGKKRISLEEFDQGFTGVVLLFEKGENFQKVKKKNQLLPNLYKFIKGSKKASIYLFIITLMLVLPGIIIPTFSRIFVDYFLIEGKHTWIKPLLFGMGITLILRALLVWAQRYYLSRLETKIALNSSSSFMAHILQLPMEFFTQRFSGEIASRVALNDKVAQLLSGDLATASLNLLMVSFYVIAMLQYDVTLALVGVLIASINLAILKILAQRRIDLNSAFLKEEGKLGGVTISGLQSIETLKSIGGESDFFSRWAGYQAKMMNLRQKLALLSMSSTVIQPFLTSLNNIVLLGFGAYRVMHGHLTMGMLVAMQSLLQSFLTPFGELMNTGGEIQEIEGNINRINDVLAYEKDPMFSSSSQEKSENEKNSISPTKKLSGLVEVHEVSFGYSRLDKPLIEDFSLRVQPGQRVALIGKTGSGKSTVIKVVSSLYQPWSGEILLDSVPLKSLPRQALNNSLSFVDQDIFLFEGTIRDNLTMWNATIPEEQVITAAKNACIHHEIMQRPKGYESLIEEGGRNFSGGQCQRLEIARSLVGNPSILLLDEATSALDPITEKKIDENLRRCGCTCIIVAHRLSTIRDCDEIIVMDKGKIVQRGTHQEMSQIEGSYKELMRF